MFYRLQQAFYRFMQGRYGVDAFSKALLVAYFIIWAVNLVVSSGILWAVNTVLFFYVVFRMFSRNISRRQKENGAYLRFIGPVKSRFALQKQKWQYRKTARYRTCPHCKANIKLPNKKGHHTVECPRCHKDFKVRISI